MGVGTASSKLKLKKMMQKNEMVATTNANENVKAVATASVEQVEAQSCCPKNKTTVIAIIDGQEREITLARTIYSMDILKKSQQKFLENVDKSKLLDTIFHFSTPEIFWQEGVGLYNMDGEEIPMGTDNVLVPVETSNTYWRFTFDDVLKNVQVHTFDNIAEYAQITGTSDLFSRSRNTVENIGVAALATGDTTYKAIYELCRKTGMPGSTAMAYFGVQLKNTTTLEMSMGLTKKNLPVATRTFEEAFALYQQVCFTFTLADAKKRYAIRAINSVMHTGGYDIDTMMETLRTIPSDKVHHALLAGCGSKESCISNALLMFALENQRKVVPLVA